jgi:Fic family protein
LNALEQSDYLSKLIGRVAGGELVAVTPAMLCELNRLAIKGLEPSAGVFRQVDVTIRGSRHDPPPWHEVPELVGEMCEVIESGGFEAIRAAAYALWRLNWIHPFGDGNGRTARAVTYFILCRGEGFELPGEVALPELIKREPLKYRRCLEEADKAWKRKCINVNALEGFLERLMKAQLKGA